MQDKRDFVVEAHRLLQPGGRVVVAVGFASAAPMTSRDRRSIERWGALVGFVTRARYRSLWVAPIWYVCAVGVAVGCLPCGVLSAATLAPVMGIFITVLRAGRQTPPLHGDPACPCRQGGRGPSTAPNLADSW